MDETIDDGLWFPGEFFDSGWSRWTPANGIWLFMAVGDATIEHFDGDLDELIDRADLRVRLPRGADTALRWDFEDEDGADDTEPDPRADLGQRFAAATAHLGSPPETIRQFADILAEAGVLTHELVDGEERWRVVTPMPLVTEALRLPPDAAAEEDRILRSFITDEYAARILFRLEEADFPDSLDTTIERLARECDIADESCREGLAALTQDGEISITRHGSAVDCERLLSHARIRLHVHLDVISTKRIKVVHAR